jgi:hypothetical protein
MPHKHKAGSSPPKQNARLDELIALFGCGDKIASLDIKAFGRRTGELIARAASSSERSRLQPQNRKFDFFPGEAPKDVAS